MPHVSIPAVILGTLFGILFLGLGLVAVIAGWKELHIPISRYRPVLATIHTSSITTIKTRCVSSWPCTRYEVEVSYAYKPEGSGLTQTGRYFKTISSLRRAEAIISTFPLDTERTVYYDPDHPDQSRLFKQHEWSQVLMILLGLLFFFVAFQLQRLVWTPRT